MHQKRYSISVRRVTTTVCATHIGIDGFFQDITRHNLRCSGCRSIHYMVATLLTVGPHCHKSSIGAGGLTCGCSPSPVLRLGTLDVEVPHSTHRNLRQHTYVVMSVAALYEVLFDMVGIDKRNMHDDFVLSHHQQTVAIPHARATSIARITDGAVATERSPFFYSSSSGGNVGSRMQTSSHLPLHSSSCQ